MGLTRGRRRLASSLLARRCASIALCCSVHCGLFCSATFAAFAIARRVRWYSAQGTHRRRPSSAVRPQRVHNPLACQFAVLPRCRCACASRHSRHHSRPGSGFPPQRLHVSDPLSRARRARVRSVLLMAIRAEPSLPSIGFASCGCTRRLCIALRR